MATYQITNAIPANTTLARYLSWAQFFGGGFSTLGWSKQSGHGELVTSGTGGSYAFTNVAAAPTVAVSPPISYTFKGAWVSGNTYVGSSGANGIAADVVTDGGLTYQHITATSSAATAPGSDATNWTPLNFEIWKSNGSSSTNLPIYVRITYTSAGSSAQRILIAVGSAVDANGNIGGALVNISPVAPAGTIVMDNGTTVTTSLYTCSMSGDADNMRFLFASNQSGFNQNYMQLLVIDRAKDSSGADSDAFFYTGVCANIASSPNCSRGCISFSQTYGGLVLGTANIAASGGWPGAVHNGGNSSGIPVSKMFGAIVPFPVFPPAGLLSNPLLGVIGINAADAQDGTLLSVYMYGALHTYLVASGLTGNGWSLNFVSTNGTLPAIRYE